MKNVYLFNISSNAAVYGIGTYIKQVALCLKNTDIRVTVVHLRSEKSLFSITEEEGIQTLHIPSAIYSSRAPYNKQLNRYNRNVAYLLKSYITDTSNLVFHLNYLNDNELAKQLKSLFDCKIILTVHYMPWAFQVYDDTEKLKKIVATPETERSNSDKNILSSIETDTTTIRDYCDNVIAIANHSMQNLQTFYQAPPSKLIYLENALEDLYKPLSKTEKEAIRKEYHIANNERIILYAGRLSNEKGLDFLIKAFQQVCEREQRVRLIIAGGGSFSEYLSHGEPIWSKITFTGLINKQILNDFYTIADIGIVPSLYEEFGFVAAEMMMHGLPIIANRTSGLKELMKEQESGLFVRIETEKENKDASTQALASQIIYLLQNPKRRQQLGHYARKRFLERYELSSFRKKITAIYNQL